MATEIDGPGRAQVAGAERRPHEGRRRPLLRHARAGGATRAEKILGARPSTATTPRGVLVEQRARRCKQEYYVGVTWDGLRSKPVMIFSDMGGIDIEEVAETHPEHIAKRHFSTLLPFSGLHGQGARRAAQDRRLRPEPARAASSRPGAHVHRSYGLTLAEINPLASSTTGASSASTATSTWKTTRATRRRRSSRSSASRPTKNAQARPPTHFEIDGAAVDAVDHRGVAGNVVEFDGDLGLVIGAGGGSLTLFDAIRKHGGKPANYCEIGGNPSGHEGLRADEARSSPSPA